VHDQHWPAGIREQRAEFLGYARHAANTQNEHLTGSLRELAGQLARNVPEAKLGTHFQAVDLLRLGTSIEQCTHAMRSLGLSVELENSKVDDVQAASQLPDAAE